MLNRKVFQQRIFDKRNQKMLFDSRQERDEYLSEILPIEYEQVFGKPQPNNPEHIILLKALQNIFGSLTLQNGTSLYIKSNKEVLLLKVLYESDSSNNIAMNCKRDFERCSCDNCEIKRREMG